jgi:hypothetical protein
MNRSRRPRRKRVCPARRTSDRSTGSAASYHFTVRYRLSPAPGTLQPAGALLAICRISPPVDAIRGGSACTAGQGSSNTDVAEKRRVIIRHQPSLDPRHLVFVDETWAATNIARRGARRVVHDCWRRCRTGIGKWLFMSPFLRPAVTGCGQIHRAAIAGNDFRGSARAASFRLPGPGIG